MYGKTHHFPMEQKTVLEEFNEGVSAEEGISGRLTVNVAYENDIVTYVQNPRSKGTDKELGYFE